IEVNFGFGLSSQQSILDHVKQQLLNSLLQRDALLGTQKHSRHGDFSSRFPHNMARLRIPELQPQSQRGHPVPEQLQACSLKLVDYGFVELREPWQHHISRAKSGSNPSQPLTLQDSGANEARE